MVSIGKVIDLDIILLFIFFFSCDLYEQHAGGSDRSGCRNQASDLEMWE